MGLNFKDGKAGAVRLTKADREAFVKEAPYAKAYLLRHDAEDLLEVLLGDEDVA